MSFSAEEVSRYPEIYFTEEQLKAIVERLKFLYWHPTASVGTSGIQYSAPLYRKVEFSPVRFQPVLDHNPGGGHNEDDDDDEEVGYYPPTQQILYQGVQSQRVLHQEVLYQHSKRWTWLLSKVRLKMINVCITDCRNAVQYIFTARDCVNIVLAVNTAFCDPELWRKDFVKVVMWIFQRQGWLQLLITLRGSWLCVVNCCILQPRCSEVTLDRIFKMYCRCLYKWTSVYTLLKM